MGLTGVGGIAGWIERIVGGKAASKLPGYLLDLHKTGETDYTGGGILTKEGLDDLRGYKKTYADRLKDPLGPEGRGIFSRARGSLSDTATQRAGAFNARTMQTAIQSGGSLTAAQRAQLDQQNQREINQGLFEGNVGISNAEATLTLSETSKLFDRMEGISKTILGAGQTQSNQGLQAIIAAITGMFNRNKAIADTIVASTGGIKSGGGGGGNI